MGTTALFQEITIFHLCTASCKRIPIRTINLCMISVYVRFFISLGSIWSDECKIASFVILYLHPPTIAIDFNATRSCFYGFRFVFPQFRLPFFIKISFLPLRYCHRFIHLFLLEDVFHIETFFPENFTYEWWEKRRTSKIDSSVSITYTKYRSFSQCNNDRCRFKSNWKSNEPSPFARIQKDELCDWNSLAYQINASATWMKMVSSTASEKWRRKNQLSIENCCVSHCARWIFMYTSWKSEMKSEYESLSNSY